ncbi:hypothetical protein D9M71_637010 [compost metagenome]
MATLADQANDRLVRRRSQRTAASREAAHGQAGGIVQRIHGIAGETLEKTVFNHAQGAAKGFLRRLENQVERTVEASMLGQVAGGAQ